jgi:DNA modification methylase
MPDQIERLEYIEIDRLTPYANNARTHSDEQIKKIQASLREFGFVNPVLVDKDNGIIAGHGRVEAARREGLTEVPCVRIEHLTEAQKKAYILADNRLALDAGWDMDILKVELEELKELDFDIDLTGFSDEELSDIFGEGELEAVEDDYNVELPETPKTQLGDIYQLGRHRLMCGDSTDKATVEKLMDGNKADMVFTDPPYNVAFNGRSGKFDVIENDDMPEADFDRFIASVCEVIKHLAPTHYYIWCNWKFYSTLQTKMEFKSCIVWAKNVFGLGKGYRHQHEFCLFNGEVDETIKNESDLWEVAKDTNYVHPTQKPVELCGRALKNHSGVKNVVDLFGGSGSSLIACEQLNRTCYMMELDPKYCDVIIDRWETFTGQKAVKL